jgi:Type II secretion system (T2SS), protein M subtype b
VTLSKRDQRALLLLAPLAVILTIKLGLFSSGPEVAEAAADSVDMAEKKLTKLRQLAVTAPGKEDLLRHANSELAAREAGLIQAETAQQAQAQLLQVIRTLGKADDIDARGGEFGPVRPLGADYGEVSVAVSFDCRIENLVNFLAALTSEKSLLATNEMRVTAVNAKEKTLNVRLTLSGVIPRKLVPEQKGPSLF